MEKKAGKQASLGRLILVHELAFLVLVLLVGTVGAAAAWFWQHTSQESVRVHRLLHLNDLVRSEVSRQVHRVIRAKLMQDQAAVTAYLDRAREVNRLFNELRRLSVDRAEDMAVQALQVQYRILQQDMNRLFEVPLERRSGVRVRLLNPEFAVSMEESFDGKYRELVRLMEDKALALSMRTDSWRRRASVTIPVGLLLAVLLVLYSRRVLRRQFLAPMQHLKEGARILSSGQLESRLPEQGGTAEVHELTQALNDMSAELLDSRKALVQQERQAALGALVPVVAHNVRNPLASIRAVAQLLSRSMGSGEFSESRQSILDTTDRLSRWVNALVSYLHPLQPRLRELPLAEVLDAALAMLRERCTAKHLVVQREGWEGAPLVAVDPDLMEQAFYSLLANAVDASPDGARLVVALGMAQDKAQVRIADQGAGMPFDPSPEDLSPGPSTKRFGTGLGIPIAYKILRAHGWELGFHRPATGGTQVCVTAGAGTAGTMP